MSNTDDLAEQKTIEQEKSLPITPLTAKPLHRQFSRILTNLLLTIIVVLALTFILFYQQSERSRLSIANEYTPLKQNYERLQALQKTKYLVNELLVNGSGANFLTLQTELIQVNKLLIELDSVNAPLYQQWLQLNQAASPLVASTQLKHKPTEELKQSSIVQLQLIWFSIKPIIQKKVTQQAQLFKQLQTDKVKDRLTLSRSNTYINGTKKLHDLKQLEALLANVLAGFEQLTIHSNIKSFDEIRLNVEEIIVLGNKLKIDKSKAVVNLIQQIDTFEAIVLTERMALATWQDYIHSAQSYQHDLSVQSEQLIKLLAKPQKRRGAQVSGIVNDLLIKTNAKFQLKITQEKLSMALLLAINLFLLIFCYLLWRLREQIKSTAEQSLVLIRESIDSENSVDARANCAETQEIMRAVQGITTPTHHEQELKELTQQCQAHQQVIDNQAQALIDNADSNNQHRYLSKQIAFNLSNELQCYQYLEDELLLLLQWEQAKLFDKPVNNDTEKESLIASLIPLYKKIKQFYLASYVRTENPPLIQVDMSLVDIIHAILMSKQAEYKKANHQMYLSCDDHLRVRAKFDLSLFQQLINLFIDIALWGCQKAELHLQLKDKTAEQDLIGFVINVQGESLETLPNLVTLLLDSQENISKKSPIIDVFNSLFAKQQGANITAMLTDDGFQLSFELPLTLINSPVHPMQQEINLEGKQVTLLSQNNMLTDIVGKIIHSTWSQFEVLAHIGIFSQHFTEKQLSKQKVDLLIVTSDVAQKEMGLITQKLNSLPTFLQPKLMVMQSSVVNFSDFGFYSQSEQLIFKEVFLRNVNELLAGDVNTNRILSPEQCQQNQYVASELPVLLAVQSPQRYQNFQRLLSLLGFQVLVVSGPEDQRKQWETGLYGILFTEYTESSLLEMASIPLLDVAVFSLTDDIPHSNDTYFAGWQIGQLAELSTLEELSLALAHWIQCVKPSNLIEYPVVTATEEASENSSVIAAPEEVSESNSVIAANENTPVTVRPEESSESNSDDEEIIPELAEYFAEHTQKAVFDFSQFIQHQGSIELALFMLSDYTEDNHKQLDILIEALKGKEFDKANKAVMTLQLNAKILVAAELEKLCTQWLQLLSGNDIPCSLEAMNLLLKKTRASLTAITNYAESI